MQDESKSEFIISLNFLYLIFFSKILKNKGNFGNGAHCFAVKNKAFGFRLINELSENSVRANIRKHSGTTNICFKSLVQSAAGCTVIAAHWSPAMHPAWGRSSKTITLNTKQMALGDLAKGEKQLWLVLWPISLFPFSEYSFILTPASHFIMIYSGENAGGGGEYVCVWVCVGEGGIAWRGAPKGTVFTANDEEHTVVFRRSDICCSQTCGRLRPTTKALTESRRLDRC